MLHTTLILHMHYVYSLSNCIEVSLLTHSFLMYRTLPVLVADVMFILVCHAVNIGYNNISYNISLILAFGFSQLSVVISNVQCSGN